MGNCVKGSPRSESESEIQYIENKGEYPKILITKVRTPRCVRLKLQENPLFLRRLEANHSPLC